MHPLATFAMIAIVRKGPRPKKYSFPWKYERRAYVRLMKKLGGSPGGMANVAIVAKTTFDDGCQKGKQGRLGA